jgi:translation initiation factor 3 subunit I
MATHPNFAIQPIGLKGHTRPLTCVQFNRDNDLLFTMAKDQRPTCWYAKNGERVGTFNGHTGAGSKLHVNASSTLLMTGNADMSARMWDVKTGHCLHVWKHQTPVKAVGICLGDYQVLAVNDPVMSSKPTVFLYDWDQEAAANRELSTEPVKAMLGHTSKINQAIWGPLNETIFSCSDDGTVKIWNPEIGKCTATVEAHDKAIHSMAFSKDHTHFITASLDHTANLYDTETRQLLKTYQSDAPINAVAISPFKNHIILGGGQDAGSVTTTDARMGKFEVKWFNKVYEEELGATKGHFGPINCLDFSYDGMSFASGSEDGYARIHHLPSGYTEVIDQ